MSLLERLTANADPWVKRAVAGQSDRIPADLSIWLYWCMEGGSSDQASKLCWALLDTVTALKKEIDEVGLYLAGSPHAEDHQVSVALEAQARSILRALEAAALHPETA